MIIKPAAKLVAHLAALVLISPVLASFWIRSRLFGKDRALFSSSQLLALVPGLPGQYIRRAFLNVALGRFERSAVVEFGTLFSQAGAEVGANVYIGPMCHLGLVRIEEDVLIANSVSIPSGPKTHGIEDASTPIREQKGNPTRVVIGARSWIGAGAVVLADVGADTVVAAGSVVTKPLPDGVVAAGAPARIVRQRLDTDTNG